MKTVILESYSPNSLALLKAQSKIHLVHGENSLKEAEAALIRSKTVIDKAFLDGAPNMKLVITATSGFDHIDWRECNKRGVTVSHTPEANAQSTAEMTFALMLAFERKIIQASKNVRDSKWREGLPRPAGLDGKTLGIIGLGRVGKRVAKMARTFGMNLLAFDPYAEGSAFEEVGAERLSVIELLKTSDWVTLHVPLTSETKHLLNNPTFNEMQRESILVNASRGAVVDENALLTALDEGTIAGAAMDVIEREPLPRGHRLTHHPKLLLTPHIGAYTDSAWDKASREAASKLISFVNGEKIQDTLPLQLPWFEKT